MANLPLRLDPPAPSTCTLHHGNCLDVMPTLKQQSVQMVFCDMPYGYTDCAWDTLIPLAQFVACNNAVADKTQLKVYTASLKLASLIIGQEKESFRYDLVWAKTRLTGHINAKKMPLRAHEQILICYKKTPTYNPQMRENTSGRQGSFTRRPNKMGAYGEKINGAKHSLGQPLYPHTLISVPSPNAERGLHPTQKPIALLEWLIATYTNPGDIVLDPVMGSGTTGVACARLGRNFIGIEKESSYFKAAQSRIDAERVSLGLDASRQDQPVL